MEDSGGRRAPDSAWGQPLRRAQLLPGAHPPHAECRWRRGGHQPTPLHDCCTAYLFSERRDGTHPRQRRPGPEPLPHRTSRARAVPLLFLCDERCRLPPARRGGGALPTIGGPRSARPSTLFQVGGHAGPLGRCNASSATRRLSSSSSMAVHLHPEQAKRNRRGLIRGRRAAMAGSWRRRRRRGARRLSSPGARSDGGWRQVGGGACEAPSLLCILRRLHFHQSNPP
jgi:hypothetical protein